MHLTHPEGGPFDLKKALFCCAAVLLALTGCRGSDVISSTPPLPESASLPPVTVSPTSTLVAPAESMPLPTASVQPLPTDSTPPPSETTPAPREEPAWDGNLATLSLDDFPTQLSSGADVAGSAASLPDTGGAGLYLVSQIPERDTWLYGFYGPEKAQGLILRVGHLWQALDVTFLTPQAIMPAMAYGDYDGDGDQELAIASYQGGGTNTNVWSFSIMDFSEENWKFLQFSPADYAAILELSLTSSYDAQANVMTLQAGDSILEVALTELGYADPGGAVEAAPGDWVLFTTDGDTISALFGIGLWADNLPPGGIMAAMLQANVVYTGSAFGLNNFSLSLPDLT